MDPLWLRLLNSDWHDYLGSGRSEDRLDNPQWLRDFLSHWGGAANRIWSVNASEGLRELRTLVRKIVDATIAGKEVSNADWDSLNSYLAKSPVMRRLERESDEYRITTEPLAQDLDSILAEVALSFAEVFAYEDPARIKICENDDCGWVFYDHSKNRSRRWCEGSGCGNLMKVRRFRKKQKSKK
jgi:predicted RNA-binding Zn ribbon-like protein